MPRYAPKMSQKNLRQIIIDIAIKNDYAEKYGEINKQNPNLEKIIWMLMQELMPTVENDWAKVDFSTENSNIKSEKTTDDGIPYIEMEASGDWETPLICIIYYDGKKLRGYVPKDGNTYNYKTKAAFGNDNDNDEVQIIKQFGHKFANEDSRYKIPQNIKLIEQDIAKRIKAKGSYVYVSENVVSKAKIKAKRQAKIESKQDLSGRITKDMVYAEISPAAGCSYVEFKLRSSGRTLKIDEANRLESVPEQLRKSEFEETVLWYGPDDCYPIQMLNILEEAGFTKAPDNDITPYQGTRTIIIGQI